MDEIFSGFNKWMSGNKNLTLHERIFIIIRLPRAIMCLLVGASLAVGGVLMQALFRNQIVEPGLVGTSSGAAFGAALYIVMGAMFVLDLGQFGLPLAACVGAIISTTIVFVLASSNQNGKSPIVSLLL